ncbi:MAG: nucleoside-triphosphatase [Candidatus Humimicrobiaceae bacterium]
MNLFLTGEVQTGKSTAIKKMLEIIREPYGGFLTVCSESIGFKFGVYICPANGPIYLEEQNCVARCKIGEKPKQHPYVFNTIGVELLKSTHEHIIVMDELGFLENDALLFKKTVQKKLDCQSIVIGVIKKMQVPWLSDIQKRKDTIVIEVTLQNRDEVPYIAAKILNFLK